MIYTRARRPFIFHQRFFLRSRLFPKTSLSLFTRIPSSRVNHRAWKGSITASNLGIRPTFIRTVVISNPSTSSGQADVRNFGEVGGNRIIPLPVLSLLQAQDRRSRRSQMILGEKPSCSTGEFGFNPMACQAVANLMRKLYADRWER